MSKTRRATEQWMIRWDAVAAIIASLIGLLALLVGGYTAYIQRQQVRAQVWPYLIGGRSGALSKLVWTNKGMGPAIVRSVEVRVDGKPQRNWNSVQQSLGIPFQYHQSSLDGNVLSPGETVAWIQFSNKADYDGFMHAADRMNLDVKVCYCSTLDDCWLTQLGGTSRQSVGQCPALPESNRFRD